MAANHVSRRKHEEQLDDLLRKDAEYKFMYSYSAEETILSDSQAQYIRITRMFLVLLHRSGMYADERRGHKRKSGHIR